MKSDIIVKYLNEVTKNFPAKRRAEIEKELQSLIEDMIADKCKQGKPKDSDIHAVLKELGNPSALAAKYSNDQEESLIGGSYYRTYKKAIWMVTPLIILLYMISGLVAAIVRDEAWYTALLSSISAFVPAICFSFIVITIIFIVLQRTRANVEKKVDIKHLYGSSRVKKHSGVAGSIIRMAVVLFLGIVLLVKPSLVYVAVINSMKIDVFNLNYINELKGIIIIFMLCVVMKECYLLLSYKRENGKNISLPFIVFLDLVEIITLFAVFGNKSIMNSNFIQVFVERFNETAPIVITFFEKSHYWILGIGFFLILVESVYRITDIMKEKYS